MSRPRPPARALLDELGITVTPLAHDGPLTREHAAALLQAAMDDCPMCQAERARTGRRPTLDLLDPPPTAPTPPERPEGWWQGRRPPRRGRPLPRRGRPGGVRSKG